MLKVGSLFSGIGGFDLGLERAGMEIVWQVENNDFCNKVLEKHWPNVKRYGDIKNVQNLEPVDIICGGFPCQPFSIAGKRQGSNDDRYLWPEMLRIIQECKPSWIIGENVVGIISMELETVCTSLEKEGYEVQPIVIPACGIGAPHKRNRVWIIAHSAENSERSRFLYRESKKERTEIRKQWKFISRDANRIYNEEVDSNSKCLGRKERSRKRIQSNEQITERQNIGNVNTEGINSDSDIERLQGRKFNKRSRYSGQFSGSWSIKRTDWDKNWYEIASKFCRVDDGVSRKLDKHRKQRLQALGNAIVPQIAEIIGTYIREIEEQND